MDEILKSELETIFTEVYPISAPSKLKKYCTFKPDGNNREQDLSGHNGLLGTMYQIDYYDPEYFVIKSLKSQVIALLKGFNQRSINGLLIQQCEITNDFETYENNVELYHGIIEITIHYEEV